MYTSLDVNNKGCFINFMTSNGVNWFFRRADKSYVHVLLRKSFVVSLKKQINKARIREDIHFVTYEKLISQVMLSFVSCLLIFHGLSGRISETSCARGKI